MDKTTNLQIDLQKKQENGSSDNNQVMNTINNSLEIFLNDFGSLSNQIDYRNSETTPRKVLCI